MSGTTDPDAAGDEAGVVRERLARAGLLAPTGPPRRRPDAERVAAARSAAGDGTSLASIVASDRS